MPDRSNGWEEVAARFISVRSPRIGLETIRSWIASIPANATVLELGCGAGIPVSKALMEGGLELYAIDAAPTLVAAFRERFPAARVACESVESSPLFDRTFDAAVAIGLIFLLPEQVQRDVIRRVANALRPEGRFLFTAPVETGTWPDALTGRPSVSLGRAGYTTAIADAGLRLVAEYVDEGENHYFDTRREM